MAIFAGLFFESTTSVKRCQMHKFNHTFSTYVEWGHIFSSYNESSRVSIIFFFGQVLYYVTILHLEKNRCCIINQVDSAAAVLNLIRARATVVMNDDRNRWWESLVQYNNNNQQRDKFIKIHYCNNNFASLHTLYSVCDICTTDEGHTPR